MSRRGWKDCPCGIGFYGSGKFCGSCLESGPTKNKRRRDARRALNRLPGYKLKRALRATGAA